MLRRKKNNYIIYPEYFDKDISRKQGRRIPLDIATDDISLKKVEYACKSLKYDFTLQKDKSYPNRWFENKGRVLIKIDKNNKIPKQSIIREIAGITRKLISSKKTKKVDKAVKSDYNKKSTHSRKKASYKTQKSKKTAKAVKSDTKKKTNKKSRKKKSDKK